MKKPILIYGIVMGLLMSVVGYFTTNGVLGAMKAMGISMLMVIIMCFIAGFAFRRANDGLASLGKLLKLYLGMILLALVVSVIISMLIMNSMSEEQKAIMIEGLIQEQLDMYDGIMDEAQLAEMEDALAEEYGNFFTPSKYVFGSFINLILYFLLSLIPGLIIRKEY